MLPKKTGNANTSLYKEDILFKKIITFYYLYD